jgi:hypothetical protein
VLGVLTETLHAIPLHEFEVVEPVHTQHAIELPIPEMNAEGIRSNTVKNIKRLRKSNRLYTWVATYLNSVSPILCQNYY